MTPQLTNGYILTIETHAGFCGIAVRKPGKRYKSAWFPTYFRYLHLALQDAILWTQGVRPGKAYRLPVRRDGRWVPVIQLDQFGRRIERNGEGA